MITVTRLNGMQVTINALLIETVEATPDTHITLSTGKKIIVLEPVGDVISLVQNYLSAVGVVRASAMSQDTEGL